MTNTEQRLTAIEKLLFETDQYRNSGGELPYKVYTALITLNSELLASAIVLENTIGTISLDYNNDNPNNITLSCNNCFTENKTYFVIGKNIDINGPNSTDYSILWDNENRLLLCFYIPTADSNGTPPEKLPIEIRVYQ